MRSPGCAAAAPPSRSWSSTWISFKDVNDGLGPRGRRLPAPGGGGTDETRSAPATPSPGWAPTSSPCSSWTSADRDPLEAAERLDEAFRSPLEFAGGSLVVSLSIGVATASTARTSAGELLRDAELAMDAAKAAGRGRVEVFVPACSRSATERLSLDQDLRHAVERGELRLSLPAGHLGRRAAPSWAARPWYGGSTRAEVSCLPTPSSPSRRRRG